MIAETVGLSYQGYGRILARTLRIKTHLEQEILQADLPVRIAPGGDSNIICFAAARTGEALSLSNVRTEKIFQALSPGRKNDFIVSKTTLLVEQYDAYLKAFVSSGGSMIDCGKLTLIRMCLLNPFFDSKEMNWRFSEEFVACLKRTLCDIDNERDNN